MRRAFWLIAPYAVWMALMMALPPTAGFYALRTLRKSGRVRAVKATPKKWLYNREDLDRVFEPVPHDAEWRADLAYVEQHTA